MVNLQLFQRSTLLSSLLDRLPQTEELSERRKVLDDLARLLSEKEMVQGEELRKMLSESAHEIAATQPVRPA